MSDIPARSDVEAERLTAATAFTSADRACTFGPSFFLAQLGRFVRDRCPDPKENLPVVQVHLADGESLDVCHIIGVSPRWVMLAVRDTLSHRDGMGIELVPYEFIRRVCIRTRRKADGASVGLQQIQSPEIVAAETLLQAVMPPHDDGR